MRVTSSWHSALLSVGKAALYRASTCQSEVSEKYKKRTIVQQLDSPSLGYPPAAWHQRVLHEHEQGLLQILSQAVGLCACIS